MDRKMSLIKKYPKDVREIIDFLKKECPKDYKDYEYSEEKGIICLSRFIFTHGIIVNLDLHSYEGRYCYNSYEDAKRALEEWKENDFEGEPEGWHRAMIYGQPIRRIEDGKIIETW